MFDSLSGGGLSLVLCFAAVSAPIIIYLVLLDPEFHSGIPIVGFDGCRGLRKLERARQNWLENGRNIIEEGLSSVSGCFQVITSVGPKIVLPNRFADEIRNHPHFHFQKAIEKEFFGNYPGFEPFGAGHEFDINIETVRGKLTQSLNHITEILAEETSLAIDDLCGKPIVWAQIQYKPMLFQLVARVSTRVFVGPELSSNEEWLSISVDYATQAFVASGSLRRWPSFLRPLIHWFLPECRKLRSTLARARDILSPVVEKRRQKTVSTQKAGETLSKVADTIGWMDSVARERNYDAAVAQIGLSLAAIHTTSELVSGIIGDLCAQPDWINLLRTDMVTAIREYGWTKRALQEMKLTDSMMKESQRHHFGDLAAMHRVTLKPLTLSDGTQIPAGALTMVGIDGMRDESVFYDPAGFHPDRFLKMRQRPGEENKWHFVTTSPEHLAFGHGMHSCPGRFFAANEVKVILVHLLNKFDWDFTAEVSKKDTSKGADISADPLAKALIRARETAIFQ